LSRQYLLHGKIELSIQSFIGKIRASLTGKEGKGKSREKIFLLPQIILKSRQIFPMTIRRQVSALNMNRPVKMGNASLKALATVIALGAVAHASLPYLPLIGPPPLRVQVARSPSANVVKFLAKPAAPPTNSPLAAAALTSTAPALAMVGPAIPAGFVPPVAENPEQSLGDAFSTSVFPLPTPDLLGITPQMLATYFRPVQSGTNSTFVGPFHVSFVPPLPPDKYSHAEYIIK
jgi:hypothetical protein